MRFHFVADGLQRKTNVRRSVRHASENSSLRRRHQTGQAIVEFGIVSILFVLILFGIADFGLLLNGWLTISSDSREAARVASTGGDPMTVVVAAARQQAPPGVSASALGVQVTYCASPTSPPAGLGC